MKLVLLNIFTSLVITFVTSACIAGQDTQAQTLGHLIPEPAASNLQILVGNAEYRNCISCSNKPSYLLGSQKVTWSQAFVLCKQSGMELASVSSVEEENAIENFTKGFENKNGPYEGYWLAGIRHGACNSDFVWFTTGKPVVYRKFSVGQPDNAGGTEACLQLFLNGPTDWAWNDIPCETKLGFVCHSPKC